MNGMFIGADNTVAFQSPWSQHYFDGFYVSQPFSKLNITIFSVEHSSVNTSIVFVNSSRYDNNQSVSRGGDPRESRVPVPLDYSDRFPMYLGNTSIITLDFLVSMPFPEDEFDYARVYICTSHNKSEEYASFEIETIGDAPYFDVTDCIQNKYCLYNYTVKKDAFYFFIFVCRASARKFNITTKFSFEAVQYLNSYSDSNSFILANISTDELYFIPFDRSRQIFMYAHIPLEYPIGETIAYLNFTARMNTFVLGGVVLVSLVLLSPLFCLFCCRFCPLKCRDKARERENERQCLINTVTNDYSATA